MALPTIDLSLLHGSSTQRQNAASDLLNAFSEHGFVKIVGHGIEKEEVAKVFEWVRLGRRCSRNLLTRASPILAEQDFLQDERRRQGCYCASWRL